MKNKEIKGKGTVKRIKKNCPNCNETFKSRENENKTCCSRKCADEYRKKQNRIKISCKQCNEEIKIKKSNYEKQDNFFCSVECNSLYQKQNENKTQCTVCDNVFDTPRAMKIHRTKNHGDDGSKFKQCKFCQTEFKTNKHSNNKFCSHDCYAKSIKGKNHPNWVEREKRKCKTCNGTFIVYKSENQIYCSRNCVDKSDKWHDKVKCTYCNDKFRKRKKSIENDKRHYCSVKCSNNWMSENQQGKNNSNWSEELRPVKNYGPNWNIVRNEIRKRDNYKCQHCGIKQNKISHKLNVHHIIPFRLFDKFEHANDKENLIALCKSCHGKIESVSHHQTDCINSNKVEKLIDRYNIKKSENKLSGVVI